MAKRNKSKSKVSKAPQEITSIRTQMVANTVKVAVSLVAVPTIVISPLMLKEVSAQTTNQMTQQQGNPLEQIVEQFNQQVNAIQDFVNDTLNTKLQQIAQSLNADIEAAVNGAIGSLGLPDPQQSRTDIEGMLSLNDSQLFSSDRVANEIDRQSTRASAAQTLSIEGQKQQQQQVASTQNSVNSVGSLSQQAQNDVVTQDVMKRIAGQNQEISALLGAQRTDALKLQQSQDFANVNLTNISRAVDSQRQQQQSELGAAGLQNLETTSKARLF